MIPDNFTTSLKCIICNRTYPPEHIYICPSCGLQGILDVQYDYEKINSVVNPDVLTSRPLNHWRYREFLPVLQTAELPPLHIGWTPVYDVPRLAKDVGVRKLFLKDDGRNPTNSFKDRASSVGVMKAVEFGFDTVAAASTGNAASSLAGLAASVGLRSYIFVPHRTPEPKVTQLLIFGATVLRVNGSYEDAFELCRQACEKFGWYNRSSGTNPYLVEGKKTAGHEIAEQFNGRGAILNGAITPDWVVVSVGDGCTVGGIGKGLQEMKLAGMFDRVPRLLGVQAEGAKPILEAYYSGTDLVPSDTDTIADSIAVGTPRNWRRAIQQIKLSNGEMIAVSDEEILDAMRTTARLGGVFGEPAGVTGVAGVKKAVERGIINTNESVLAVITGNGLKDIQTAMKAAGKELSIEPDLHSLEDALSKESRAMVK
jgi:threonine synthase